MLKAMENKNWMLMIVVGLLLWGGGMTGVWGQRNALRGEVQGGVSTGTGLEGMGGAWRGAVRWERKLRDGQWTMGVGLGFTHVNSRWERLNEAMEDVIRRDYTRRQDVELGVTLGRRVSDRLRVGLTVYGTVVVDVRTQGEMYFPTRGGSVVAYPYSIGRPPVFGGPLLPLVDGGGRLGVGLRVLPLVEVLLGGQMGIRKGVDMWGAEGRMKAVWLGMGFDLHRW